MSIEGIILDKDYKMIKNDQNQIFCKIDFGSGNIENHIVDEEFLQENFPLNEAKTTESTKSLVTMSMPSPTLPVLNLDVLKNSGKLAKPTRIPGKNSNAGEGFQKEYGGYDIQIEETEQKDREFQWTSPMIKLLIETYKTVKKGEEKRIKLQKHLWQKIANIISEKGYLVSGPQCDNKWKGLQKIYKKYKDQENTTGAAGGAIWEYYDAMDEILFKKPAISPVALASNLKGFRMQIPTQSSKKRNLDHSTENIEPSEVPFENVQLMKKKKSIAAKKALNVLGESPLNRVCSSIEEHFQAQHLLQNRFVTTFENYLEFVKSKFDK